MPHWIYVGLGLVAGLVSGVQGPANGALSKSWGLARAVALNGAVVFVGTLIGMLLFPQRMETRTAIPWYYYIGGFCGLTIISVAAAATPKIGAADYTVALVLGMLGSSVLVDTWGWFGQAKIPLSPLRIFALILIAVGVFLIRATRTPAA